MRCEILDIRTISIKTCGTAGFFSFGGRMELVCEGGKNVVLNQERKDERICRLFSLNQERKDLRMSRILSILASFLSWFKQGAFFLST